MNTTATSLRDFLASRLHPPEFGQAELSRQSGVSISDINAIMQGRVKLPGADKRRKLARALGVSHVDLLVAAGELSTDDVRDSGLVAVPLIEPERADLLDKLERVRLHDQTRQRRERTSHPRRYRATFRPGPLSRCGRFVVPNDKCH